MDRENEAVADAELVVRFKGGQESAFDDLVHRHMKDAFAFAVRLTGDPQEAEELSQEGFVKAFGALAAFRGEASFRSWLYQILINLHRDRRRRWKREETRLQVVKDETERRQARNVEDTSMQADELSGVVKDRVQTLPDRQREVLVLHVYQGLDYREIANVLGCSYDDVKMNLSLARKKLREQLKEYL